MERLYRIGLTCVLVCVVSLFGTLWVYSMSSEEAEANLKLHAQAAVLIDGDTSRILYGKNENIPLAMASTTKIMTCLMALENARMDDIVVISDYAASMPDVQLNAKSGDSFYMEDLLYALMLESHNDVAVAIAEHVGGSEEEFANMMNRRAKELGCIQTNFVTANGLDAEEHYTTAEELARITIEALSNKKFIEIINTSDYSFSNIEKTQNYYIHNKNSFLDLMDGAFGVKTGFTNNAGYCFVGALKQNEKTLVSVVLGSGWPPNKNLKWMDTKNLMKYGLENYEIKKIGENSLDVGEMEVEDGLVNKIKLRSECEKLNVLLSDKDEVKIEVIHELKQKAPIGKNKIVGWVYYKVNNWIVGRFPVYTTENVAKKSLGYCMMNILKRWLIL